MSVWERKVCLPCTRDRFTLAYIRARSGVDPLLEMLGEEEVATFTCPECRDVHQQCEVE